MLRKKAHKPKSCTGAWLLRNKMKKTIIAIILILSLSSTSVFAVTDNFTVTTVVAEIGLIKVTTAAIGASTMAAYNGLTDFGSLVVTAAGAQTFSAYMTTMSNKRTGYTVTFTATAMASTVSGQTSYINYTVGCNTKSVTTNGVATITPVTVLTVSTLSAISSSSKAITLTVDPVTFETAASGSYEGNVTFTFTAT